MKLRENQQATVSQQTANSTLASIVSKPISMFRNQQFQLQPSTLAQVKHPMSTFKNRIALWLFVSISLLFLPLAQAEVNVSGFINADTTWTAANSPYIVVQSVLVSQGFKLTIESGVVVKFNSGAGIQVNGTLVARGTATQKIVFKPVEGTTPGSWGSIGFADSSVDATVDPSGNYTGGSVLEHCVISYGGGDLTDRFPSTSLRR